MHTRNLRVKITNSPSLPCPFDSCSRWFRNPSGLKKHARAKHTLSGDCNGSSTSDLGVISAPHNPPFPEPHDPGPHPSPGYHNPTSSPHTPSPVDAEFPLHPHSPNPNDYRDTPRAPHTPTANFSPPLRYSSPLSWHRPQMFPESPRTGSQSSNDLYPPASPTHSYYGHYDDPGYRSDNQEDEDIDSGGPPLPPGSPLPYNDAAPTTRVSHQSLNGAPSNLHFFS